jgi:hypothetical protein
VDKLIIKLFGVNRMNFVGWCVAGLLIVGASLVSACAALSPGFGADQRLGIWLCAIWLVLMGIFCLLLQLYCSLLAEKLERRQIATELPSHAVGQNPMATSEPESAAGFGRSDALCSGAFRAAEDHNNGS